MSVVGGNIMSGGFIPPEAFFRSFSPAALWMPTLVHGVWQDTGQTVPVSAEGQAIAAITDFSGNGRHATQGTGANQGFWTSTAFGAPALQTNGTTNSYTIANSASFANSGFVHAFLVGVYEGAASASRRYFFAGDTAAASPMCRIQNSTDVNPDFWAAGNLAAGGTVLTASLPSGALQLIEIRIALNNRFIRVDQNAAVSSASGNAPASPITRLLATPFGDSLVDGGFGFLMVRHDASAFWSAAEVTAIRTRLGALFGQAWS